jgi:hypothetical protein
MLTIGNYCYISRERKAQEIKLLCNSNFSLFPGICFIYSIPGGRTDLFHLKISKSMYEMNIATMEISEMVKLGVLLLAGKWSETYCRKYGHFI